MTLLIDRIPGLVRGAVAALPLPAPARPVDDPQRPLQWRLLAAQDLVRPGFMALRAVRAATRIVDFEWIFASSMAGRMLGRRAIDLYGKRLLEVLADQDGCESVFIQYRRVVELGVAGPTQLIHRVPGSHDIHRHGAVRLGDGVAVTLINVSAARRAHALGLALRAQRAMAAAYPEPAAAFAPGRSPMAAFSTSTE